MNKSEIAERAAREIHDRFVGGCVPEKCDVVIDIAAIVERAIAESQAKEKTMSNYQRECLVDGSDCGSTTCPRAEDDKEINSCEPNAPHAENVDGAAPTDTQQSANNATPNTTETKPDFAESAEVLLRHLAQATGEPTKQAIAEDALYRMWIGQRIDDYAELGDGEPSPSPALHQHICPECDSEYSCYGCDPKTLCAECIQGLTAEVERLNTKLRIATRELIASRSNRKMGSGAAQEVSPSPSPDAFQEAWAKYNKAGLSTGWERVGFVGGFKYGFDAGRKSAEGDTRELKAALRESAYLMSDKGFDELDVEEWDHRAKAIRDLAELLG